MNTEEKIALITRNADEVIGEENLKETLKKKNLKAYVGYEPSGGIHLGHLVTMMKLLDFQKAGIKPIILLANWHAWLNQKGSWEFIDEQMEIWKKGMKAAGLTKAQFVKGTDFQTKKSYINDVMTIGLNTTVTRGIRSMQTVARDIEHAKISQLIYPLMQIVDIKALDISFVAAGMEQRKIHALAIETFQKINFTKKPIFIHTGLISSLKGGEKMSSSSPESMISIRDSKSEIDRKIKKAHCPEGQTQNNPILDITKLLIFPKFEKITIYRDAKFGGNIIYDNYNSLKNDFEKRALHPLDLKLAIADSLEKLIAPIRKAWKN